MTTTVTISEATQRLGMSPRTIHRWIRNGKVNAEKVDGKWYVDIDMEAVKDNGNVSDKDNTHRFIETLQQQLAEKDEQLVRRDEQIDHLTQLLAIQSKTTAMLTERLHMIEDMRRRNWWKRLSLR